MQLVEPDELQGLVGLLTPTGTWGPAGAMQLAAKTVQPPSR